MNNELILKMMEFFQGDAKRIQHFTKVYNYAKLIGELEGLDERTQCILETAAIVHDIGIKASEVKYGSSAGKYQEIEGPAEAAALLAELGYTADIAERVCYLVGHHHTYTDIQGADYQILVEADFLVNFYEDNVSAKAVNSAVSRIFQTASGRHMAQLMYGAQL